MSTAECDHEFYYGLCAICGIDMEKWRQSAVKTLERRKDLLLDSHSKLTTTSCRKTDLEQLEVARQKEMAERVRLHDEAVAAEAATRQVVKSVGWGLNEPGLQLTQGAATARQQRDESRLRKSKRLALMVDLDKTVLHTTMDPVGELWRRDGCDVHEFTLGGEGGRRFYTKLRPGTHEFLAALAPLFEMQVQTFGSRSYALAILKFLDPHRQIFGDRILTMDETFSKERKTENLAALFPAGLDMVAIIDDNTDVWEGIPNLIPMLPYEIFPESANDVNATTAERVLQAEGFKKRLKSRNAHTIALGNDVIRTRRGCLSTDAKIGCKGELAASAVAEAILLRIAWLCDSKVACNNHGIDQSLAALASECVRAGIPVSPTDFQSWIDTSASHSAKFEEGISVADATPSIKSVASQQCNTSFGDRGSGSATKSDRYLEAIEYINELFALFDEQPTFSFLGCKNTENFENQVVMQGIVSDVNQAARLSLLVSSIECLSFPEISDTGMITCMLGDAFTMVVATCIAKNTIEKAEHFIFTALGRNQFNVAVLLLRALRQVVPHSNWGDTADHDLNALEYLGSNIESNNVHTRTVGIPPPNQVDRVLPIIGAILVDVHKQYYSDDEHKASVPVPELISRAQHCYGRSYSPWALAGTVIVFSGVIDLASKPQRNPYWRDALSLGAQCRTSIDATTTHLVCAKKGSEKFRAAVERGDIEIVSLSWLVLCKTKGSRVAEMEHSLAPAVQRQSRVVAMEATAPSMVHGMEEMKFGMDDEVAAAMADFDSSEASSEDGYDDDSESAEGDDRIDIDSEARDVGGQPQNMNNSFDAVESCDSKEETDDELLGELEDFL